MNRSRNVLALALIAAFLSGGLIAQADAPANACDSTYTASGSNTDKLKRYIDCRDDRIEKQLTRIENAQKMTPAPTPAPTATPKPSTTPTPTVTPAPTSTPTAPAAKKFPTAATTGVPSGWVPKKTVTGEYKITTAGAVVEDLRVVDGSIIIDAKNVTLRRVEVRGGVIYNFPGSSCQTGLTVEDTSIIRSARPTSEESFGGISVGGYTATRVKMQGIPEGFRAGGVNGGCGPVVITDSFAEITYPDNCRDWHGDGVQGYDGPKLTVRNTTLILVQTPSCGGTAPFFYPHSQGNTSVDIDGLLVKGGGFPFRLGMPGPVKNLNIVDKSWNFGPIDVKCSVVTAWQANIVTLGTDGQPTPVRAQPCNTEQGN